MADTNLSRQEATARKELIITSANMTKLLILLLKRLQTGEALFGSTEEGNCRIFAMADTNHGRQEAAARNELIITSANMTDKEWRKFCSKREEKVNARRRE